MRCKIYASDEGFGPLVRQSAIVEELRRLDPSIEIVFQTYRHREAVGLFLNDIEIQPRYNNIRWDKRCDGSPDVLAIKQFFGDYETRADRFIEEEVLSNFEFDFVISDFVYEAFTVAKHLGVPAFGVAHFTWDWFFSKLYPLPVTNRLLDRFAAQASLAEVLYFPRFTPSEILQEHKNAMRVPLVVRKHEAVLPGSTVQGRFNVLVIDSGSEVLKSHMKRALRDIEELDGFHFFASAELGLEATNVMKITKKELFIDYIPHVDLVVARAGFNTISECIAFRTPMLLVGEAVNPEMSENMMNIKREGLGSFVGLERFAEHFTTVLPHFVKYEYPGVLEALQSHRIESDGARVIAEDILSRVRSKAGVESSQMTKRSRFTRPPLCQT